MEKKEKEIKDKIILEFEPSGACLSQATAPIPSSSGSIALPSCSSKALTSKMLISKTSYCIKITQLTISKKQKKKK